MYREMSSYATETSPHIQIFATFGVHRKVSEGCLAQSIVFSLSYISTLPLLDAFALRSYL